MESIALYGQREEEEVEEEEGEVEKRRESTFEIPEAVKEVDREIKERIEKFQRIAKETGRKVNDDLRGSKSFRNPGITEKLERLAGVIDSRGSLMNREYFDPSQIKEEDKIDGIMKRLQQQQQQQQRGRTTVEFQRERK